MPNNNPGIVNYPNRFRQICNFNELKYGTITPSDIDLVIEYHDKKWLLGELKLDGVELPIGQRLLLERAAIDYSLAKKQTIAFVAHHFVTDYTEDIDVSKAFVTEICIGETTNDEYGRRRGEWHKVNYAITVKELCDSFIGHNNTPYEIVYGF